jgi:hypothetical protein
MNFKLEKFADCIEEMSLIAKEHYEEVAPYKDIHLNIRWDRLIEINEAGVSKLYTARCSEGDMCGYVYFFVNYSLEYGNSLQASMSNIFIRKEDRGFGHKFISWCDTQLKELGVQVVNHHVKVFNDYGVMLERLGYDKMNIEYSKRLDKE